MPFGYFYTNYHTALAWLQAISHFSPIVAYLWPQIFLGTSDPFIATAPLLTP